MTDKFKEALDELNAVSCEVTALAWFEKHSGNKKSIVAQALTLSQEAEQLRKERDEWTEKYYALLRTFGKESE